MSAISARRLILCKVVWVLVWILLVVQYGLHPGYIPGTHFHQSLPELTIEKREALQRRQPGRKWAHVHRGLERGFLSLPGTGATGLLVTYTNSTTNNAEPWKCSVL